VAGKKEHLAIDILLTSLSSRNQMKLMLIIDACVLVFALTIMLIGGSNLVYITFILGQKSAALQIPLAYVYGIIPFSGLLVIYYQLVAMSHSIIAIKTSH
jgi:TRAP-type C4-dicarboxylate transport system permease small subunit